jgi:hypothetical protein
MARIDDLLNDVKPGDIAEDVRPDNIVNTPADPPQVDPPADDTPADPSVSDEVVSWFKSQGIEGTTREDFIPHIEKAKNFDQEVNKYKPFETEVQTLKQREADMAEKMNALKDLADPLKIFGSEDEYKAALLKKQHPELDPNSLMQVMTKELSADPRQVLKLQFKLNNPEFNDSQIEAYLANKYGFDDFDTEFSELETLSQTNIKIAEKEARKEFNALKEGVKVPEVIDIDAYLGNKKIQTKESLETLQNAWEPLVKTIPGQLDKVVISEGENTIFEFAIDEDFKKGVTENIGNTKQWLISQGLEPNAENTKQTVQNLKDYYFNQNKVKIMNAYASQKVVEREIELKKEMDNPTNANTRSTQRVSPEAQSEEKFYDNVLADIKGK